MTATQTRWRLQGSSSSVLSRLSTGGTSITALIIIHILLHAFTSTFRKQKLCKLIINEFLMYFDVQKKETGNIIIVYR